MTTTGIVGGRWRAEVTGWGAIEPRDGSGPIEWYVAADDRWHRPREEVSLRQALVDGTPVVETRIRIPTGDALQRIYSVADGGGFTIIEVINESNLPIAVAFTGGRLTSRRPPAAVPVEGIDLPADTVMFPIAHRAGVVVGVSHAGPGSPLPETVASAEQVARGWLAQSQRASRLHLPDQAVNDAVTAARCELLLDGPSSGGGDPVSFVLGIAELVRLGNPPAMWVPELAAQLELLARSGDPIPDGLIQAAARVLHAAGEHRAVADLRKMNLSVHPNDDDAPPLQLARLPHWVERRLVVSDDLCATLLPVGFPVAWIGVDFEAHGLPIGLTSHLSLAIRWHGDRPAVLWEVSGAPMTLAHADWTTAQLAGEALWPRPCV